MLSYLKMASVLVHGETYEYYEKERKDFLGTGNCIRLCVSSMLAEFEIPLKQLINVVLSSMDFEWCRP